MWTIEKRYPIPRPQGRTKGCLGVISEENEHVILGLNCLHKKFIIDSENCHRAPAITGWIDKKRKWFGMSFVISFVLINYRYICRHNITMAYEGIGWLLCLKSDRFLTYVIVVLNRASHYIESCSNGCLLYHFTTSAQQCMASRKLILSWHVYSIHSTKETS